ncbi:MAG: serine O-acetyltransferase [Clostridia bacterium]|nr:serine O-acetyltransferase [Clostridia bacterium]
MFDTLKRDIDAVMARDPAAHSRAEVFFCYPGFIAVRRHRRAHRAYLKGHFLLARWINFHTYQRTGIDIHPGATLGEGVFIDHGTGVVIGETAVVGDYCTIYQGATLGGTGKDTGKRHPTLGRGVTVGAGSKVLGPINIGNHVKIGAGAIVLKDVPDLCTVVGNPGRIVRGPAVRPDIDLDHGDLPDPMLEKVEAIEGKLEQLEQFEQQEMETAPHSCAACPVEDCPRRTTPETQKKEEK